MAAGTVLIVEDDFIQREGLAALMRQQRFSVVTSIDGHDALNKLSSGSLPGLILNWAASLGATRLIRKPFEEELLLAEIQRYLVNSFCSRTI